MRFFRVSIAALLFLMSAAASGLGISYDSATGILAIPSVSVGSATYVNVTLRNVGPGYRFDLQSATAQVPPGPALATYDLASGMLTLPSVTVGSTTYDVTMQDTGNYTFVLKTASIAATKQFTALSSTMPIPRANHTATLLPNGQVLIAGGFSANVVPSPALNTAELYDPTANTFTPLTARMASRRTNHTATLLANGQVLITGGQIDSNDGDGNNSAELYNPLTQTFTAMTATMTSPRGGHAATLLANGKVLITGGFNNSSVSLKTAEQYDPATQTFTANAAAMTSPRSQHMATLLPNGQVLLTGGQSSHIVFDSAEVFDPTTQAFTTRAATMTTPRDCHSATLLLSGLVLLAGGGANSALNTAELFDPATQTFTASTATMTSPRFCHAATRLASGSVLLTGGGIGSINSFTVLSTAELYKP